VPTARQQCTRHENCLSIALGEALVEQSACSDQCAPLVDPAISAQLQARFSEIVSTPAKKTKFLGPSPPLWRPPAKTHHWPSMELWPTFYIASLPTRRGGGSRHFGPKQVDFEAIRAYVQQHRNLP
jgi:hypothetical protein